MENRQGAGRHETQKVSPVEAQFLGVVEMFRNMGFSDKEIAEVFNGKSTKEVEQKGGSSENKQG